ncbi:uncharacterized protein F5891DRAFT_1279953 [Suillus fuscotomentosus]|uniref:Uncharacterized protein n=1 Tax=Suillus fuscotomentosus TaxID=1912939 RepID=A0AAD4E1C4_9AGAM|nr:uncharacterized protein F5891DRAFT_1279953 [Suillus fuscotomentosus]KAG1897740.1 hypothetical protein F5891DRAFT_1279953 [Suillus fuscotomentosus]
MCNHDLLPHNKNPLARLAERKRESTVPNPAVTQYIEERKYNENDIGRRVTSSASRLALRLRSPIFTPLRVRPFCIPTLPLERNLAPLKLSTSEDILILEYPAHLNI